MELYRTGLCQSSTRAWIVPLLWGVMALGVPSAQADWIQFLGADRDGRSDESGLLREWPQAGPDELWSAEVGVGFGGASIRDGEVYLLDREDDAKDVLRCVDLENGDELWRFENPVRGRLQYNGSRSVPTVGSERVFALGPFGHLYCVARDTHELAWKVDLVKDYGGSAPQWGYAASPLLYEDLVIVPSMAPEVGLLALDQETGALRWKSGEVGSEGYSSPALYRIGERDLVFYVSPVGLFAIEASSGKILLSWSDYTCRIPIPAPTPIGDGRFFLTGGYRAGSVLVQVSEEDGRLHVEELFRIDDNGTHIHQPIEYEGHIYANLNNGRSRRKTPGLTCLDLEGQRLWTVDGNPNLDRGNLILVDGMLLGLGGQDGVLYLLEPSPDGFVKLASAKVFDGLGRRDNNLWAPMAFSDGKLVLRSQTTLKCLDLKQR